MPEFTGLPGTRRKLKGITVAQSVSAFDRALRKHRVVSTAGHHGSLTAYRDDAGNWRGVFCQWLAVKADIEVDVKSELLKWIAEWLPKCSFPDVRGAANTL